MNADEIPQECGMCWFGRFSDDPYYRCEQCERHDEWYWRQREQDEGESDFIWPELPAA